ncbi:hypothetical protein O9K51_00519 [Purpureocillium lavendulum]|uniref:Glycophorin A domain-containing protein n=1 Tax=Purpureocillium lavendulum TaxID=1247861 RepID=A0AB34G4B4_9HYPO|nr:hypothetical protein O9K51_00519 [Purpureocillium lavendulum]
MPRPVAAAALAAVLVGIASATPVPRGDDAGFSFLFGRACSSCGADGQLCCTGSQVCTTLANDIATCVSPQAGAAAGGSYGQYTTTWTETRTFTSTIMTHWAPAPEPTAGVDCVPQAPEQQACGSICCAGWQTCAFQGQCSLRPGYQEPSTVVVTASDGKLTTRYSAPFRVTGTTTVVGNGPTTTVPNSASATASATSSGATATSTSDGDAIGADGGTTNNGLSGGAIAGIVIGTLVGVALLLLLCFCCIARGLWNAIFGRKKHHHDEKRERVDVYEERYSRHGSRQPSAYSRRERHGGWFGGGGGGPSSAGGRREKKKSGGGWWLGLAGAAATILALLNLKKDKKKPPRKPQSSRYSDSYYSYTDATSASKSPPPAPLSQTDPSLTRSTGSSSSGGRRTQYTRRSGGSRPPPSRSHYSRSSRRP